MSSHVIVNLLRPFTERIWFHFKMEPPAETELFYCKTISQWQILFYAKRTILFPHGTYHHVIWLSSRFTGKLWTSPEILRENFPPARGTQRGDVFSFSIVCFEIMMRSEPYSFDHMTARGLLPVRQLTPSMQSFISSCCNATMIVRLSVKQTMSRSPKIVTMSGQCVIGHVNVWSWCHTSRGQCVPAKV